MERVGERTSGFLPFFGFRPNTEGIIIIIIYNEIFW